MLFAIHAPRLSILYLSALSFGHVLVDRNRAAALRCRSRVLHPSSDQQTVLAAHMTTFSRPNKGSSGMGSPKSARARVVSATKRETSAFRRCSVFSNERELVRSRMRFASSAIV